jgi:osmotically-inducible protein OsmY
MSQRRADLDPNDPPVNDSTTRNPDWDSYVPEGKGRTDEQIRADIHQVLMGTTVHETAPLTVRVEDGLVTLAGEVSDAAEQERLTQLVRSVPSVKGVHDELSVTAKTPQ